MRINEGRKMFYWLAGAATLLLALAQPALAKCEAESWDSNLDIIIDYSQYEEHVRTHSKFELKKRFLLCDLKMEPVSSFDPEFNNLRFSCDWTGKKSLLQVKGPPPPWAGRPHCVSTRAVRLHPQGNKPGKKHIVVLVPYFTQPNVPSKREVEIHFVDAEDMTRHNGVAHGTGEE